MKIQLCVLRQIASEERFAEISAGRASASRVAVYQEKQ
jgi:hypothetical protein